MGDVIRRKIVQCKVYIGILLTGVIVGSVLMAWNYQQRNIDEGAIRVEVNTLLTQLENEPDIKHYIESDIPYCTLDRSGEVLISSIDTYKVGEKIDWHTIGSLHNYQVPIVRNGLSEEVLVVDCVNYQKNRASETFYKWMAIPLVIWCLFLFLLYRIHKIEKEDIWHPIQELHEATISMIEKKTDVKVQYDYEGDIGTLCHDFERMREEIINSSMRELKLKEKERAMYASISHDLKTPLATITGYLEGILYDVAQTPEEINHSIERMLSKAVIINKLIDDMLEHSKAQLNELSICKQEVYARDFFAKLLSEYAHDAEHRKYELSYSLPDNVLLNIDIHRITEVMQNLIENAVKYGKESIHIQVGFEALKEPGSILVVSVKDNGRGIDAADLPFIFDMFYRGNKARTLDIPGSGLGLNISKYIIEQHGGQIECDSIVGIGTTISFSIPYL